MGYVQFLAWLTATGLRVAQPLARRAFNAWVKYNKKLPAEKNFNQIANSAKNMAAEKRHIPKEWNKFKPEIVKPIKVPEQTKNILNIKSTLKGRPVKVVPETKVGDALKALEEVGIKGRTFTDQRGRKWVFDKLGRQFEEKVVESAKILPFKRPPGKFKGGIIDKSLSGRSRDI